LVFILIIMKKRLILLGMVMLPFTCSLFGQSPAALQKLSDRYSAAQLDDVQTNTHYKYVGLLMYYTSSWLVSEAGQLRAPSEAEILAVDLDAWLPLRSITDRVIVPGALPGRDIVLLSRDEFEAAYLAQLSVVDRQQYEAYKAAQRNLDQKSNP
jgi:hypothetical protein